MSFDPQQKDILIVILGCSVVFCLIVIGLLAQRLGKEKKRSQMPILLLKPNMEPLQTGLYLTNLGDVPAQNIVIHDLDVMIESSIGGAVTIKFEPVKILPARQEEKLRFKIFSGSFPIANVTPENIVPHLTGASLEVQITYNNLANIRFDSIVEKEKDSNKFNIKEIKSA